MSYKPYVIYEYYCDAYKGNIVPMDELDKAPKQASRHTGSLTYNCIVSRGSPSLTVLQQEIIQEVVCQQADFEYKNTDEINTILQSYSINDASAQFDSSWSALIDKDVVMKRDVYALLSQTGLCRRLAK